VCVAQQVISRDAQINVPQLDKTVEDEIINFDILFTKKYFTDAWLQTCKYFNININTDIILSYVYILLLQGMISKKNGSVKTASM
jgi:hypothetical protein